MLTKKMELSELHFLPDWLWFFYFWFHCFFVLIPALLFGCSVLQAYLSNSIWSQLFSYHGRNPFSLRGNRSIQCNCSHVKYMVISDDDAAVFISVVTGLQVNEIKG